MREQKVVNLKYLVEQLIDSKNAEYADKKINLVSNVFMLNNMIYSDGENPSKMLGFVIDYVYNINETWL